MPNPIAHTTIKTTLERYAMKGSDNVQEATLRCV